LAKNTPEKSRRFLAGLGVGIAAASLTLGLTARSAAEPARDDPPGGTGNLSLHSPPVATSPTSSAQQETQPATPAAGATTAIPSRSPSATPTSATSSPPRTAATKTSSMPSAKAQAPAPRQTVKKKPAAPAANTAVQQQSGPTAWSALNAAISRIPGYRQGGIRWSVTGRYGHYGTTDLATSAIYISPNVPLSLLDSVVRHEYAHVVSVRAYGGQWQTAKSALNRAYGGSGMTGAERAADCMARAMGATWLNYTACTSSSWQAMAQRLLSGRPV
jgi:hypothetical protein